LVEPSQEQGRGRQTSELAEHFDGSWDSFHRRPRRNLARPEGF